MKIHAIALASLTLVAAASASAAERINVTGASALRGVIANTVWNEVCKNATDRKGYNLTGTFDAGTGNATLSPSANFWAITCTTTAAFGTYPAGSVLDFRKSDQGGSGQGVYPIIQGASKPQVATAGCTGAVVTLGTGATAGTVTTVCPNEASAAKAHVGISDLEPTIFAGVNKPTDEVYDETLLLSNDLVVKPIVQTVFGVAVNSKLYDALFAAQKTDGILPASCVAPTDGAHCVPTIGKAQASTFFAGFATDWKSLSPSLASPTNQINICRRAPGSGTQAAANRHLMENPSNSQQLTPADYGFSNPAVAPLSPTANAATITAYVTANVKNVAGATFVFEGPGTGNVIACLNQANTVTGYAIGHVSKENAGNQALAGTTWAHIRLDGTFPGRESAKAGRYDYLFESTAQYSQATYDALSANAKLFVDSFISKVGLPDSLKFVGAAEDGVAALPNPAIPFSTGTADEKKFYSRVTRGGNSNTPLTLQQ